MRICRVISTGRIIESQSGGETDAHLEALQANALAAGYPPEAIEVLYITEEEFSEAMEAQRQSSLTYADHRRTEYPPMADYLDAQVKQASTDPGIQEEGKLQETDYFRKCHAVKVKYPKA